MNSIAAAAEACCNKYCQSDSSAYRLTLNNISSASGSVAKLLDALQFISLNFLRFLLAECGIESFHLPHNTNHYQMWV